MFELLVLLLLIITAGSTYAFLSTTTSTQNNSIFSNTNRLNVIYNIQVFNFDVPALSVQPIVENAIKHGVMKKIEGGTVKISTYEDVTSYVVVIEDDGVGFDINDDDLKTNKHIGLSNVKHRINSMCKGDIKFESEKNKGTKVTISFYKE